MVGVVDYYRVEHCVFTDDLLFVENILGQVISSIHNYPGISTFTVTSSKTSEGTHASHSCVC
jgi:hypothetical protein